VQGHSRARRDDDQRSEDEKLLRPLQRSSARVIYVQLQKMAQQDQERDALQPSQTN
jgi:hypothetical protein